MAQVSAFSRKVVSWTDCRKTVATSITVTLQNTLGEKVARLLTEEIRRSIGMDIEEIAEALEALTGFLDIHLRFRSLILQRMIARKFYATLENELNSEIHESGFATCVRIAWLKFGSEDISISKARWQG
ncbi:MAG: hypothetical protein ACE5KO_07495 [Candidatus Bathyarchaeia archaeon]